MLLNIRYFVVSKRYLILVTLLFLLISSLRAQYDPEFSHYFDMEPSFNPGSVGKESKLNIETAYALDFALKLVADINGDSVSEMIKKAMF